MGRIAFILFIGSSLLGSSVGLEGSVESSSVCPVGWLPGAYYCYKVLGLDGQVSLDWIDADVECEKSGGYLAEPETAEVSDFLFGLAAFYTEITGVTEFYIGLEDIGREGTWRCPYSNAIPTDFFWGEGSPNTETGNSEDCAMMILDGGESFYWKDVSCQNKSLVAPICQTESTVTTAEPTMTSSGPTDPTTTTDGGETTTDEGETTTDVGETTTGPPGPAECPQDWLEYEGACYAFFSDFLNSEDGENTCKEAGAHLASVHSVAENDFISTVVGGLAVFMGGLTGGDGEWRWSDSSPFDYNNWKDGFPTEEGGCVYRSSDKFWYNVKCTERHPFLCKVKLGSGGGTTTSGGPTDGTTTKPDCPGGWTEFQGRCYSFSSDSKTWDAAESTCSGSGGHLASVHSGSEHDFLSQSVTSPTYLGGKMSGSSWSWSDGSTFDYDNWESEYPVPGSRACLYRSATGQWFNVNCAEAHKYICKI